jgi:hypothetical protein
MFEDKKELLLLSLGILFSLGVGCRIGLSYGLGQPLTGQDTTLATSGEEKAVTENKVVKYISRSVSGIVRSITDQEMVLEDRGDTLTVEVALDARILRMTPSSQEEIRLNQVKVRDRVDALLFSQPDGSFLASEVTVLADGE